MAEEKDIEPIAATAREQVGQTARPRFRQILARAAGSGVNLGVLGAAALGAAALVSWPILAIGGATYAALVAWDTANPDFWKKVLGTRSASWPRLPDPGRVKDPPSRAAVEGILAARKELVRVISETPGDVKANLVVALSSIEELEGRAATLVARAEDLARYLTTVNTVPVKKEIVELAARARAANDPHAKAQFENARQAREEQLRAVADIEAAKERLDANLHRIVATLAGLPAKVVRMRALDAQAMEDISGDLNAELDRMNGEIKSFEETLKSLAEVRL